MVISSEGLGYPLFCIGSRQKPIIELLVLGGRSEIFLLKLELGNEERGLKFSVYSHE